MNKGYWMAKGAGHISDPNTYFDNPSRIESKRSNAWFLDPSESDFFPNKKQAVEGPDGKKNSEPSNPDIPTWENTSNFQAPNQFIDRLYGPEMGRPIGKDNFNLRRLSFDDQFRDDASVGLSIAHAMENTELFPNNGGIRKEKVGQILHHPPKEQHSSDTDEKHNMSREQAYNREVETGYAPLEQVYYRGDYSVKLMGHTYNRGGAHMRSLDPNCLKGDDISISIGDSYSKGDATVVSFGGFPEEQEIIPVGKPLGSYDVFYNQSTFQASETACEKISDANATINSSRVAKSKPVSISKGKSENKSTRKEAPNSFPSNVRSLISTGMLDGVPVKYVSLAREEFRGIIKGSGYLCGCQSCNYAKVLNAYEFERHAGCKTKHPNNHIYFENGKTIYQIVQELRSTHESLLFDTIQTVSGAPINQKAFRSWKESFQAATRELQRIYGKEELNL